jgi:hypothetical protein
MNLNTKTRLFLILFVFGLVGVLSFLLIDLSAFVALLPVPAGSEVLTITPVIKVLSLIQPAVLLGASVLIGVALAPRVGLSAPVAESFAAGQRAIPALRAQLIPGVLGGIVGAGSVLLTAAVLRPYLTTETNERISAFARLLPLPTRVLYGGIAEELLLRWGFMTLLVWAMWRLLQKHLPKPTAISFVVGILLSSFVFGVAHLPAAYMLLPEPTTALILFVIVANSSFGIVAGYLYWKYGLESAIIAHMLCHVLLATASYVGAYF